MPILSREVKKALEKEFSQLRKQVTIEVFSQEMECQSCKETRSMMEELAEITAKITVNVNDFQANGSLVRKYEVERIPCAVVATKDGTCARFSGIPSGFEFAALVETIKAASSDKPIVSEQTAEFLSTLERQISLEVFVSPTCPYCPQMASLAAKMGLASRQIKADIIVLNEYPHLAVKHGIQGIPHAIINGTIHVSGAVPEKTLLENLKQAVKDQK